jgi:hypothetical protein
MTWDDRGFKARNSFTGGLISPLFSQGKTVFAPHAPGLITDTVDGRSETIKVPFGKLNGLHEVDFFQLAGLNPIFFCNTLYFLHFHISFSFNDGFLLLRFMCLFYPTLLFS